MARIFLGLALFAISLLFINIVLGFRSGDYNGLAQQYAAAALNIRELETGNKEATDSQRKQVIELSEQFDASNQKHVLHTLFGVAAALVTLLVNSITVTYFIGTSRWCKEVVDAYRLDPQLTQKSLVLKRQTFPWALSGILTIIAVIFLGGAALPAGASSANWVMPHYITALAGTMFIGWSFFMQAGKIGANYDVIQEILAEVHRIRAERGLDADQKAADETPEVSEPASDP